MSQVCVINVGHGNQLAISRSLSEVGHECVYASTPNDVKRSSGNIIIPGVSSFDRAASLLKSSGLFEVLVDEILVKCRPTLGICVGMQLLLMNSEEGLEDGFGFVEGRAEKFVSTMDAPITIPHMGWNTVDFSPTSRLNVPFDNPEFYFLHSYRLIYEYQAYASGVTFHGQGFVSVLEKENIFGVQFHPEKSHKSGLELLAKFGSLV